MQSVRTNCEDGNWPQSIAGKSHLRHRQPTAVLSGVRASVRLELQVVSGGLRDTDAGSKELVEDEVTTCLDRRPSTVSASRNLPRALQLPTPLQSSKVAHVRLC